MIEIDLKMIFENGSFEIGPQTERTSMDVSFFQLPSAIFIVHLL